VYLATTFLLRFCSRASRTYCPIRHLENCDSVIDDVAGVVEISEHDYVFHVEEMPEIAKVTWHSPMQRRFINTYSQTWVSVK